MRFRYKVIMINIAFISIALGVLGFVMIYKNFNQAIDIQTSYAIEENNLIQASIEYPLLDVLNERDPKIAKSLYEAGKDTSSQLLSGNTFLYIFYDDKLVYSNDTTMHDTTVSGKNITMKKITFSEQNFIPNALFTSLEFGGKNFTTSKEKTGYQLFIASKNILEEKELYIITKRSVNDTYNLLYSQIGYFFFLMILVLAICSFFLYVISTKLTKPLEKLNEVTDTIAQGNYEIRADISSDDEIGMLVEKFNNMALAISQHIEELNLMVKQREQFVADFTHEIKTPMTTIIGYADTLRSKELTEERKKLAYQYIYSEGKRLENMSMKLFDLIYLKDNDLVRSEIQTLDIAKEIAESMQPILDRKEIHLETELEPSIIYGDLELLKTVFINLIDNARKASPDKSTIWFRGFSKDNAYVFQVEDHGCGMDEETKQHICDEFYMADKSRSRAEGGAGLGMSLASLIILRHGATMDIESELGKGSIFTITLPLT